MNWQQITDHINQAKERLLEQYRRKPKIESLLVGITQEIQVIEDELTRLALERGIDTAVGAQLDGIGEIIGMKRPAGLSDADYIFLIRTQIILNLNEGTAEEVIQAAKFFTGQPAVMYNEVYPAAVDLFVYTPIDPVLAATIKLRLERFLPTTVSLEMFGYIPPNAFLFDTGFGFGDDAETTGDLLSGDY